ncbi:putative ribonuclease H-like domain-containing protein [Tanacetum coccineum]
MWLILVKGWSNVWDNAKRVNHQKISNKLKYPQVRRTFVPLGVLTRTGAVSTVRLKVNNVRPNVSTVRPKVNPVRPNISTDRSVGTFRPIYPSMDNVRPRASYSPIKRFYYTTPALRPKDLKKVVKTFGIKNRITVGTRAVVSTSKGKIDNVLKKSKWVWRPKGNYMDHESKESGSFILKKFEYADPKGISKSVLTWANKLIFQTMKTTMEAVWLLEVIQNEKNSVLFTDTKCLILSPSFKLLDENQVILRAARQNDVYSLDLKNIVPSGGLENQLNHKVKIIRCDHGTKFKNNAMNEFCAKKGIKREFSVARTPQQNGVAERKNRTLIEAARSLAKDSLLPYPILGQRQLILLAIMVSEEVKQQPDGIFISQDKYVADTLKKFDFWSIRTSTTPTESNKPLVKDEDGEDVDVHVYMYMIGSLMYLTASRPNIMYLKHQTKVGLWYPKDSPFDLEAFSDIDYGGASLDKKSTTGGYQFLGKRLISWQCKKQTIVANSTTEVEYVAVAHCCGQVLWVQNQMMDYGFNFMNTKIHIDNERTISVIKNLVSHSRTKHIEIRFHFIRDCYEKRRIEVVKIHTDHNVADLLIKGFDVTRFNFLIASIGMLNL